jgi:glycosyltransferase involved in cell wall biosynthesis
MPATVSINLCCYNSEKYLRETLDSVVDQTYHDWELIIINDGSTDSTETIVKEYINRGAPIVYHYQENSGLGHSRNEALARSHGKYIAFIDHDDVWLPEKLRQQITVLETEPDYDLVYTNYYVVRGNNKTAKFKRPQPAGRVFDRFLSSYPIHVSTVIVRQSAVKKLDPLFNPNLLMTEDFDFCMRLLIAGQASYLSQPLATYRYHTAMSSVTNEIRLIKESIHVLQAFLRISTSQQQTKIIQKMIKQNGAGLAFKLGKDALAEGQATKGHDLLHPYRFANIKICFCHLIASLPFNLASWMWPLIMKIKNKGH